MAKYFIGVDPGIEGAIARIGPNNKVEIWSMPTRQVLVSGKKRRRIDRFALDTLIELEFLHLPLKEVVLVIEGLGPIYRMPSKKGKKGSAGVEFGMASTNFQLGGAYGACQQAFARLYIEPLEPHPQTWKSVMLNGSDRGKDAAISMAKFFHPKAPLTKPGCRIESHNRAEALLLAEYGRRTMGVVNVREVTKV